MATPSSSTWKVSTARSTCCSTSPGRRRWTWRKSPSSSLVEQYLAVIEGARRVRLELAADWLVMAAWLTWLKSRLLLPADALRRRGGRGRRRSPRPAAARPVRDPRRRRLARRPAAARPGRVRPRRAGRPYRDRPLPPRAGPRRAGARLSAARCGAAPKLAATSPAPLTLWTVQDALHRLGALLGSLPDWTSLERFLPDHLAARPSAAPPWRARCWPAWKWPAAAPCGCGRSTTSAPSWCAASMPA